MHHSLLHTLQNGVVLVHNLLNDLKKVCIKYLFISKSNLATIKNVLFNY